MRDKEEGPGGGQGPSPRLPEFSALCPHRTAADRQMDTLALHELLHQKRRMWSSLQAWLRPVLHFLIPPVN